MKRSTKSRKVNKFSKTMDPPTFLGGRQLKDFQKVTLLISSFSFLLFFFSFRLKTGEALVEATMKPY